MRGHRLLIVGAGGQARVAHDCAISMGGFQSIAFASNTCSSVGEFMGCCLYPQAAALGDIHKWDLAFVAIGDNKARRLLMSRLTGLGIPLATLVHPSATISESSSIEPGSIVCPSANIGPCALVGPGCIVNTMADVEHDCVVEGFCHLSPGAMMGGGSSMGELSWLCLNATVSDHVSFPSHSILAAGSVYLGGDAPGTYIGAPAMICERKR